MAVWARRSSASQRLLDPASKRLCRREAQADEIQRTGYGLRQGVDNGMGSLVQGALRQGRTHQHSVAHGDYRGAEHLRRGDKRPQCSQHGGLWIVEAGEIEHGGAALVAKKQRARAIGKGAGVFGVQRPRGDGQYDARHEPGHRQMRAKMALQRASRRVLATPGEAVEEQRLHLIGVGAGEVSPGGIAPDRQGRRERQRRIPLIGEAMGKQVDQRASLLPERRHLGAGLCAGYGLNEGHKLIHQGVDARGTLRREPRLEPQLSAHLRGDA